MLKIGCGLQQNIVYIFFYVNSLHFASLISLVLVYKNLHDDVIDEDDDVIDDDTHSEAIASIWVFFISINNQSFL